MSKILVKNRQHAMAWANGRHRQVLVHTLPENFRKKKSFYDMKLRERMRFSMCLVRKVKYWRKYNVQTGKSTCWKKSTKKKKKKSKIYFITCALIWKAQKWSYFCKWLSSRVDIVFTNLTKKISALSGDYFNKHG